MKRHPFIQKELAALDERGLKRSLPQVSGRQSRTIIVDGRELLNFCSNNYLGLADDPRLAEAALSALQDEGFGAGASRLVCGNSASHRRLEETMARLKGVERCLLFTSGYMANTGIIPAVVGRDDVVLSDKLNHASIVDGILLSRAKCRRYPHKDMPALKDTLAASGRYRRRLIVTDSVFSMDGDCAPLHDIVTLAEQYDALVMVDEAHAFGVLGATGQGLVEELRLKDRVDIQMGTLSKAAGAFGAYCGGTQELIELIINRARSFIYTTGLPPLVAAAANRALEIMTCEPERRLQLRTKAEDLRNALKHLGFDTGDSQTPIIPIIVKDATLAVSFSRKLAQRGIFVQAIRPPTVPIGTARLRATVMATHTAEDLRQFIEAVEHIGRELNIIK